MHSEWPIISVRLEIIYERTFRTDVSGCPIIDLSVMRILAGQLMSLTRLNARLSIFGSMIADCDYSFDFLLSL